MDKERMDKEKVEVSIYEHSQTKTFDSMEEADDFIEYEERVNGHICRIGRS